MAKENKTEGQLHYESITNYFKYLVTVTVAAITIITGVVLYFTFQNLSEARKEVNDKLSEMKIEIKDASQNSQKSFEKLQNQANKEVQDFKNEIQSYALNETKSKVSEAFDENNIRELVERVANQKLEEQLEKIVQQKIYKQMSVVPELVLAVDKIRNSERSGLNQLDSLRHKSTDPFIRKLANEAYLGKAEDYYKIYSQVLKDKAINLNQINNSLHLGKNISPTDTTAVIKGLVQFINNNNDLDSIASAIIYLNKLSNNNFGMFDFDSINDWAKKQFKNKK